MIHILNLFRIVMCLLWIMCILYALVIVFCKANAIPSAVVLDRWYWYSVYFIIHLNSWLYYKRFNELRMTEILDRDLVGTVEMLGALLSIHHSLTLLPSPVPSNQTCCPCPLLIAIMASISNKYSFMHHITNCFSFSIWTRQGTAERATLYSIFNMSRYKFIPPLYRTKNVFCSNMGVYTTACIINNIWT